MPVDVPQGHRGGIYIGVPMGLRTGLRGDQVQQALMPFIGPLMGQMYPVGLSFYMDFRLNQDRAGTREQMVIDALDAGFEWIFWVDDDVIIPRNACLRLFQRQADIIGGLITTKSRPPQPLIYRRKHDGPITDWQVGDVVPCEGMGWGCTLIKMEVFRRLERPWFAEERKMLETAGEAWTYQTTEDLPLMYRAVDAGFEKVYVDTSVNCRHMDWNTGRMFGWDTEHNAPYAQLKGERELFCTAEQQLKLQEARDSQGVKE